MAQSFAKQILQGIAGPGLAVDNAIVRFDGITGKRIQSSGVYIDDAGNLIISEIRAKDGNGLKLYDDGGNGIFIRDDGNIGIGTITPDNKLHIVGGNIEVDAENNTGELIFRGSAPRIRYRQTPGHSSGMGFYFYTESTDLIGRFSITPSGKIGISNFIDNAGYMQFRTKTGGTSYVRLWINNNGSIGIGTTTPATSALVDLTSTTGALLLTRMTTAQRDALTAMNGMILYNSTLNQTQTYENGAWRQV